MASPKTGHVNGNVTAERQFLPCLSLVLSLCLSLSPTALAKGSKQPKGPVYGGAGPQAQADMPAGLIPVVIPADGVMREFFVHIPPILQESINAGQPPPSLPMVMVFHGGLGLASRMDTMAGFDPIADREGFITVYPQAINRHWHDGRNIEGQDKYDDVAFVNAIIDYMQRRYRIDHQRVYACGISNGGFFCQYLALHMPDKLAAIASVAATLPSIVASARPALKPMSVLFILGMNDPLMPFKGGPLAFANFKDRGMVVSAADAAQFWVKANRGNKVPTSVDLPDTDPSDNCRVKVANFSGGLKGSEVLVYGIEGGGHTWPGAAEVLPKNLVGETCRDISASEVIWDFFKRHM